MLLAVLMALSVCSALAYTETYELTRGKTKSAARIYESDSTKSTVLAKVGSGREVVILWDAENYYCVAYGNVCGYMLKKYVKADSDLVTPDQYVAADRNLKLYKSNSTKKGSLRTIPAGNWMLLLSETASYYRVRWGSQVGYVLKKYASIVAPLSIDDVVNTVYFTPDREFSMQVVEYKESEGVYLVDIQYYESVYGWYGALVDMSYDTDDGITLTFQSFEDGSTVVVEWLSREAMDYPVVRRGENTGSMPKGMFADYVYDHMLTD